ncbi:hypothetical protein VCV18_008961 [Metarhizium anisopliae]
MAKNWFLPVPLGRKKAQPEQDGNMDERTNGRSPSQRGSVREVEPICAAERRCAAGPDRVRGTDLSRTRASRASQPPVLSDSGPAAGGRL